MNTRYKKNKTYKAKAMLLLLVIAFFAMPGCAKIQEDSEPLLIQYFYINVCGSCDPEEDFLTHFEALTGVSRRTPNMVIDMYNVYEKPNSSYFQNIMEDLGEDPSEQSFPLLLIGDRIIPSSQIDDTLNGRDFVSELPNIEATIPVNGSVIVYFYMPGCHDCEKAKEVVLNELPGSVTINGVDSPIVILSISAAEREGLSTFGMYCQSYHVDKADQRTPLAFIGYQALPGLEQIRKLPALIEQGVGLDTPLLFCDNSQSKMPEGYRWSGVLAAGLLNGVNPCAISMTILLLSLLASTKKWILPGGLAFAAGKFIGFLLLGTLFFGVIDKLHFAQAQTIIKIVLTVFALAMAALNIHDFLAAKREEYGRIRLQLPTGLRRWNHRLIKWAATPVSLVLLTAGCLLLGLLVSGGEFLCTGQIYISVMLQMAHSLRSAQALVYLAFYSLAFIIPLVILVLLVGKGKRVFDLSEFFRRNMKWVKLANAIIFIALVAVIYTLN